MTEQLRNYGFVEPVIEDKHYLFGASSLPRIVLQGSGQWDDFLPIFEPQSNANFDTFGCTVFGTENPIETLDKKIYGHDSNFSDRFLYIVSNTRPPGNDPHAVAEAIRDFGLIPEVMLPMTETFEEFVQPDPMDEGLKAEGKKWLDTFEFGHEWVFTQVLSLEKRKRLMQDALQYSPLSVSVTAWIERDGVFVDDGRPNSHWCMCYGWNEKGWKIFDSYDASHKIVSFDHEIKFCKRYHLAPRASRPQPKKSLWAWLRSLFNI